MNKAYKIIWSHVRKCYVVVAEIAKNHGKNNVKSIVSQLAARSCGGGTELFRGVERGFTLTGKMALPLITAGLLMQAVPGFASTITDAKGTSLTGTGKVHDIYAQKVMESQKDGFNLGVNQFQKYQVTAGDIANMYFQTKNGQLKADSLVNLVNSRINIEGTVNAIKNGRIDGDLYFISPNGMAVGKTGVINAGRLVGLVPDNTVFGNFERLYWNNDTTLMSYFKEDISKYGSRNDKGEFVKLSDRWSTNPDNKASIDIAGTVNTRSGMVLGASNINIKTGALLKAQKEIDFTNLVNAKDVSGNVVTKASLSGVGMKMVADTDKTGDIILRAEAEHENNSPVIPDAVDAIINTQVNAHVAVDGAIETDGKADISANARTQLNTSAWGPFKASDVVKEFLNDIGLNIDAEGARKYNTASVALQTNGKIEAAGDVTLQSDASVDLKMKASSHLVKTDDTSSALPVAAVTVAKVKNKALVDVAGDITSKKGDISLNAAANVNIDISATAMTPYTQNEDDQGNAIFFGLTWLYGNSLAQIDVAEGEAIKAEEGEFSAEAGTSSELSTATAVEGMDKTFASTSVTVQDFDTAANVNINRSIEAESIKATAENEISGMGVSSENANGEGEDDYILFVVTGDTNANVVAKKLKDNFGIGSFINGGALKGLEDAFATAEQYITAGAAVAVVDNVNTAAVTVAPDATLTATGDAVKKDDDGKIVLDKAGNPVPGGDVTLEANTHVDSLHHAVAGWANKQDEDTDSAATVAAGVLYSNIENDAKVELQGDTKNHKGATLVSEKGSVNLNAAVKQVYDPAEPYKNVAERAEKLWNTLKAMGKEFPELANFHSEAVKVQKELEDGTVSTEAARASFADFSASLGAFLSKQGQNLVKLDAGLKGMIQDLSDCLSPDSYTNYYVRSYVVDSQDTDKNLDLAASVNIAKLHNKGIVSLGEKADISAGKNIAIDASADTNVVSATGNGGEFLAMSESNGNGAGASVAVQDFTGDSLILSGKNVTLTADKSGKDSGDISLKANNEMIQTGIILSAGKADKHLAATGSLNLLTGGGNSLVLVDDETTVKAANAFTLSADNKTTVTNVVGGLTLGSSRTNATVGAGVAVNLLDVNTVAMIGDTGSDAATAATDTESEDFKKKTIEEQNRIKADNALATARKVAAAQGQVRKMDRDFTLSTEKLTASMGAKTASGAEKGTVTAQDISVTGNSSGTLNAVGIEGAEASESHAGFDFLNNWDKKGNYLRDQLTDAAKNVVGYPLTKVNKAFGDSRVVKNWNFGEYQPIQPANDDASQASFNATAAASVAWNKVNSETAAIISGGDLKLRKQASGDEAGSLLNTATDDVFSGAWSGAAAVNWFNGAAGAAANNNAKKGALGAALAVNHLNRATDALILSSDISQAGAIKNMAIRNGAEAAAALGLAVTNDSQGTSTDASVAFGLAMNKSNNDAHAILIDSSSSYKDKVKKDESKGDTADNTLTYSGGTTVETSAYDGDVQVAGGVDLAWVKTDQAGVGIAAGITAAVGEIKNDIQSGIQGGSYTGVRDMKAAGEDALTQVNAAVGLGFSRSEKGVAGAGSVTYTELANNSRSYITGTETIQASGEVSVTSRDISGKDNVYKEYLKQRKVDATGLEFLSKDTKDKLGKEAGSAIVNVAVEVAEGKGAAAGAAISYNNVTNKFSSDIANNKNITAASVKGQADVHTNIVSVAAGVSVSESVFGGAGSLSFNDLDQDNGVSFDNNRDGSKADSGVKADTVTAGAKNTSHIVNVTGDFAGGRNAVGLGVAYNKMADTTGIAFSRNRIGAKDAKTGTAVSLDAQNEAYALALSLGAAATYKEDGTVAAHGNFGVNRGYNDTVAVIGEDKEGKKATGDDREQISNITSVKVNAADKTTTTGIAGSGALSVNSSTVALGVGVALTDIGSGSTDSNKQEAVRAEIGNADITTLKKDNNAPVVSATAKDTSKATTVAVGAGITKESKVGAQLVLANAEIDRKTSAALTDTTIDKNAGSKAALVTVQADSKAELDTGAAALQLSGEQSFLTGVAAVGVNRIKDTTAASVSYAQKQNAAAMNLGNLSIGSNANGKIVSAAMGASGSWKGTVAAGGSGSYNYIENNSLATLANANVDSKGNIGVVAQSDEAINNYAGVLNVNILGQGVSAALGVSGSNNKLSGSTEAVIKDSTVAAAGSSDDDKVIRTKSRLKEKDNGLIDGAVTKNTWSSGRLQEGREEEKKTGVVVDASATHGISSVLGNAGVAVAAGDSGIGASVAGLLNINRIGGKTTAKILDSRVNTATTRSNVSVKAADYTNEAEFSGAAAVAVGDKVAGAAGLTFNFNTVDRETSAGVSTSKAVWDAAKKQYTAPAGKALNTVYAKDFAVTADAKQAMSAFNVAGAVAGSENAAFETGDNGSSSKMRSATIATVTNTTLDYTGETAVKADHEDRIYNLNVDAGLTISATGAGSLNIGVGVVDEDSSVVANMQNSELKSETAKSKLSVGASNSTTLESKLISVGVAAGFYSGGVAGSVAVNNIDTSVITNIAGSTLQADTIEAGSSNNLKIKDATGTGGAGLMAGIGVGVDVNTLNDTVSTVINNSTLKAKDSLSVNTATERAVDSTVAGVGAGAAGIAVNVLSVTVNGGINDLEDVTDSESTSDTKGTFSHKDSLGKVLNSINNEAADKLTESFYGLTDGEKKEAKQQAKVNAEAGNAVKGTGVHTYVQNKSVVESTSGSVNISNTEKNDADLNGGSGAAGAGAVSVADVIYHMNRLNDISVGNSTVKGASVSMRAEQGNIKANNEDAFRLRTVQASAGVGGVGVGYAGLTTKGSTGITVNKSTVSATNGNLTLQSVDTAWSKSLMIGASAAVVTASVSMAHNENAAGSFVTVSGGSKLSAQTTAVKGSDGKDKEEKVPAKITLETSRTGHVKAKTTGVGAGGVAVAVNLADATDASDSTINVQGSNNTFTADTVEMNAVNAPVVKAESGGTAASLIGVSVMKSEAEAASRARVIVANGNGLLGKDVGMHAVIGDKETPTTYAETHGTSVGIGAAVNPNKALATTRTGAAVSVGKEYYKTNKDDKTGKEEAVTNLTMTTQNNAGHKAYVGNTTIGLILAVGVGDAEAAGDDKSTVAAGGGNVNMLNVSANGSVSASGYADGDSGGAISVGTPSTITLNTKTTNRATLSGQWDVKDRVSLTAAESVTSRGSSRTGAGGIASVNWVKSDNNVTADTKVILAQGAVLNTGASYVLAENNITTGAWENETYNNHMNMGGVFNFAPDVKSTSVVTANAGIEVKAGAAVTTTGGQVYDAHNNMKLSNKVEGKGGGVAENMGVHSINTTTENSKITVEEGAVLEQKGEFEKGDLILSTSDNLDLNSLSEAWIGGFEGYLNVVDSNAINRNNQITVNGKLASSHDINVYAGADPYGSDAQMNLTGIVESHNNTVVPLKSAPTFSYDLKNNHQVVIGKSGDATAVRNINITADSGSEAVKKNATEVAWLFLGADKSTNTVTNTPGKSNIAETNNNFVNVEGSLKTGIHNKVVIDISGAAVPGKGEPGVTVAPADGSNPFTIRTEGSSENFNKDDIKTGDMDYATQLGTQLKAVEALIKEYSTGTDEKTMASYLGYVQQRQRILEEMDKRNLFDMETVDGKQVKVYKTSGLTVRYVEIPKITASGGSITIQSDSLYGGGSIQANGAPQVKVTNHSSAYLKLDGVQIEEGGGEIRFRGSSVTGNEDVNKLNQDKGKNAGFATFKNDTASGQASAILVENDNKAGTSIKVKDSKRVEGTYNPITDVAIAGNLVNNFGDIRIRNASGSITAGASVIGRTVQMQARDSISQDYIDGIVNIGGRPQDLNAEEVKKAMDGVNNGELKDKASDKTVPQTGLTQTASDITNAELGRIAGDSIYIAAADINVNGLIQSGFSKYEANIGETDMDDLSKLENKGNEVTVQGRTLYKVNDGGKAVYDKDLGAFKYIVQVYYDPQAKNLVVEDIDTKGGKIYLTGRISSTGNGKILAMDGGADIAISNGTAYDLNAGKILNNDIEGKITITDLAKDTWTEYTPSSTKTIDNYSKVARDSAAMEKAMKTESGIGYNKGADASGSYKVKEGLRYNWTLGTETGTTRYFHKTEKTLLWGLWNYSTDQDKLRELEKTSEVKEVQSKTGKNLGEGNFVDVISGEANYGKELNSTEFGAVYENRVTSNTSTVTGSWKESGKWYALWMNPSYHLEWNTKTGSTQSYTFSLKADRDIGIGFIGKENGSISLQNTASHSGDINLTDDIKNNTADATVLIRAAGGSITQKGDAPITAGHAELQAKGNMEGIHIVSLGTRTLNADGKTYTASDKVKLTALSTEGGNIDIRVAGGTAEGQALPGNVEIQKLESSGADITGKLGDITLKAEGNITQAGSGAAIKGLAITLTSEKGGIGTKDQAVVMESHPEAYGLDPESSNVDATARKDIYLAEDNGDMRIGSIVSKEGDVTLTAAGGRLLDALPLVEHANNVEEDDLVRHWIDAGLIAGTEEYKGAYISGLEQDAANYRTRVQEQFQLFASGEANAQIKAMFTKKDGSKYASAEEYLKADTKYQEIVDKFKNPTYVWTKEQLLYSIRNAIVNKESGVTTETQGKAANVQGNNVTLNAKGIGLDSDTTTTILASEVGGGSDTAIANLKKLANADAADVTLKDSKGNILTFTKDENGRDVATARNAEGKAVETDGVIHSFVIGNKSPLGVNATEQLNITTEGGNAYVAGRSDAKGKFAPVNVGVISTGKKGDVRLYTQEGIYNALDPQDQANIQAKDLIAYGGTKDIGAADKYLGVDLKGDLLTANADGSVYIRNWNNADQLRIGSIFAGNAIALNSDRGMAMTENKDYGAAYLNAGKSVLLESSRQGGQIGTSDAPIRILNNGAAISVKAWNAHIRGVNGLLGKDATMDLNSADVSGSLEASSEGALKTTGTISAGNVASLYTDKGGDLILDGDIHARYVSAAVTGDSEKDENGNIVVTGNIDSDVSLELDNRTRDGNVVVTGNMKNTGNQGISVSSRNGSVFLTGTVNATKGDINVNSSGGDILLQGDLDAGRDIKASTRGKGDIVLNQDIDEVKNLHAVRNIILQAENGDINVSGMVKADKGSVSAGVENGNIAFTGDINAGSNVTANVAGNGNITYSGATKAGGDIRAQINGDGDILYDGPARAGGSITALVKGDGDIIYSGSVSAGDSVTAEAGDGAIWYNDPVNAGNNVIARLQNGLIVYGDSVTAGNNVEAHISGEGNVFYLDRVEAGNDIIARLGAGDILYGGDLNAGGRVSTLTGNGTVWYLGAVSAGKDLEDDIKADEGRVVYYERHDLIRDGKKSGSAASSGKNAKADQIKVVKPGGKMK